MMFKMGYVGLSHIELVTRGYVDYAVLLPDYFKNNY